MTQEHQPQLGDMTDGQHALRGCPSFETLCLYVDNELSPAEIETVVAHTDQCVACTAALEDMRLIRQALLVSTPAAAQRSIRLTEADVEGERPIIRSSKPLTPVKALPPPARFTIPFAPAMAAIAALLLIAVVAGDMLTRDEQPSRPTLVINGTVFPASDADLQPTYGAASEEETNPDASTSPENAPAIPADEDDGFWNWWRAAEILLIAVLAGLLATIYLQRRTPRA